MTRLLWLAALLALTVPLAASAETRFERRYYDVYARDGLELYAAITTRSPLGVTALTEIVPTSARWQAKRVGGGYVIDRLELDDVIVQTLPRWVNKNSARTCLQRQWESAMAALRRHEDVHRDRYAEYSRQFRREALRIPPQPSPAALEQALTALNRRLEAETVAWQQDYDRRTQYGRLEGVLIRPC